MKIALYDIDSKIPNLALMKLSTFCKDKGAEVGFYDSLWRDSYDKMFGSKIFKFSSDAMIPEGMVIGGTGSRNNNFLLPEIDACQPDYSLYAPSQFPSGERHSIGFAMRGCRFRCKFCLVPKLEGKPRSTATIDDVWTYRNSNFVYLLDNDFFGNPEWKARIKEIKDRELKVCFSQGINIRIITDEQAQALASVKFRSQSNNNRRVYFAWDRIRDEKLIVDGIKRVINSGIKPHEMQFYVLVGFDSTPDEDLHRIEMLKNLGCDPYVMPYDKQNSYQKRFARWVNHKAIFKSVPWAEYKVA